MLSRFSTLSIESLGRLLAAVMVGVLLLGAGVSYYSSTLATDLERTWTEQERTSLKKTGYLALLRQALGYGGMIHHLKNYVLRGNPNDLINGHTHILQIRTIIVAYHQLELTPLEIEALDAIEAIVDEYQIKLAIAEKLNQQNLSTEAIDAQIKVDDGLALEALYVAEQYAYAQRQTGLDAFRMGLEELSTFSARATIGTTLLFVFLLVFFGWGIRKRIVLMYQREVDDKKQLADEKGRVDTVMDTIVDGIVTINAKGKVLRINDSVLQMFGYSARDVVGQNVRMLMPEPYRSNHDRYIGQFLATGAAKIIGKRRELEAVRADGTRFPIELAVTEMEVAGERQFVGVIRDITDQRESERLKKQFIATVSHELRTPLTSIQGALGMIDSGVLGEVPDKVENMLSIASNNTRRLVLLVNDLLDLEKLDAGKMTFDFQNNALAEIVGNAYYANMPYADEFGVHLELEGRGRGLNVDADAKRLEQVVTNLLSNAIKFSPKGASVVLKFGAVGDQARVEVIDKGPGIADEFKGRIFTKFAQADGSDTRMKGGSGLGLSICKAIVEAHGGTIGFTSEIGEGSTFYFEIPRQRGAGNMTIPTTMRGDTAAGSQDTEDHSDTSGAVKSSCRILVVEDNSDLREILVTRLGQMGSVVSVSSLKEARALLSGQGVDLAVLDVELPDGSGLELLDKFEESQDGKLPVVVFSGQEVDAEVASRVESALVKSRDDVGVLVGKVRVLIKDIEGRRP